MSMTAEQVLIAALELPDVDRLELIEALIGSVENPESAPFDESWREVIQRRSDDLASSYVKPVPWTELKRRAREAARG